MKTISKVLSLIAAGVFLLSGCGRGFRRRDYDRKRI